MKARITNKLVASLKPQAKPYEVTDIDLKGFIVRVQPNTGSKTYYVRYVNPVGQDARYKIGAANILTMAQAREEAKKILGKVASKQDPQKEKKRSRSKILRDFIRNEYQPWVLKHRKRGQKTLQQITSTFKNFLPMSLTEITPKKIDKWKTARLSSGIKLSTINRDLVALRALLSKAKQWEIIDENPLGSIKLAKTDNNLSTRYLNTDEERRLLVAIDQREQKIRQDRLNANQWRLARNYEMLPDIADTQFVDHLKPMILLSINTGMRQGELFNLKWQDVNLADKYLIIRGSNSKSGQTRHIPLNQTAYNVLLTVKNNQDFSKTELVFVSKTGGQFTTVKRSWQNLLKLANITDFRWHDLRHHFASKLVMVGVDLNTVRELLGHSDIKMTLRYAHLAPEHKARAVEKINLQ